MLCRLDFFFVVLSHYYLVIACFSRAKLGSSRTWLVSRERLAACSLFYKSSSQSTCEASSSGGLLLSTHCFNPPLPSRLQQNTHKTHNPCHSVTIACL